MLGAFQSNLRVPFSFRVIYDKRQKRYISEWYIICVQWVYSNTLSEKFGTSGGSEIVKTIKNLKYVHTYR